MLAACVKMLTRILLESDRFSYIKKQMVPLTLGIIGFISDKYTC